jgi:hypothetical protein
VAVKVARTAKEAHENQLGSGVRIEGAGDEEVGNRDAVGGFGPDWRQRGEGGGQDCGADVVVGYDGEDGIEGCGKDLEGVGGLKM